MGKFTALPIMAAVFLGLFLSHSGLANECVNNFSCNPNEYCLNGQCTDRLDVSQRCTIDFDCGSGMSECIAGRCEVRTSGGGSGGGSGGAGGGGSSGGSTADRGRTGHGRQLPYNGVPCIMTYHPGGSESGPSCVVYRDGDEFALDYYRDDSCNAGNYLFWFVDTLAETCLTKWRIERRYGTQETVDTDLDGVSDFSDFCRATPSGSVIWQFGEFTGCSQGQIRDSDWSSRQ